MSIAELARGAALLESFGSTLREKGGQGFVQFEAAQVLALCDVVGGLRAENQRFEKAMAALEKSNQEIKRANTSVMLKFSGKEEWEAEVKKSIEELQELSVAKESMDELKDRVKKLEKSQEKQLPEWEARMKAIMETVDKKDDHRKTMTLQVEDKVNVLQIQLTDLTKRMREDKHRVENSADHAVRATDNIKKIQAHLTELEETLKADFKKVARVVKGIQEEMKNVSHVGVGSVGIGFSGTSGFGDSAAKVALDEAGGSQLKLRIERLEEREADVHANFERQSKRIRKLEDNDAAAVIAALSKKFADMNVRHEHFEQHMADQLFNLRSREVSHVVTAFKQKWARLNAEKDECLLRDTVTSWLEYLNQRSQARRALAKTTQLFIKRHAGARFRTWWYVAQKDIHRKEFEHLNDYANSMQAQLTTATSTMSKRDKSTSEHFREISARVNQAEKKLDSIVQKKADMTVVRDLVGTLEARFAQDYDFDGVRASIEEVWEFVKPLESNKAEADIVAKHSQKINEISYEMRQGFQKFDGDLQLKATIVDMSRKSDAGRVDEVIKILASQMDRLTATTTSDFEQLRYSVQRFLELSPDLRKAALSNGLMPREECMACSMLNKSPRKSAQGIPDRGIPVQTVAGTNNVLYRLSPSSGENYSAQADKIINEKLKFPTRLKQSVSMARDQSLDTPLRALMDKGASWLSGGDVTHRGSMDQRASVGRASVGSIATSNDGDGAGGNRFSLRAFFPSAGGAPQQQHNQSTSETSTVSKASVDRSAAPSPMPPVGLGSDKSDSRAVSPMPPKMSVGSESPQGGSKDPPNLDEEGPDDPPPREPSPDVDDDPMSPTSPIGDGGYAGMQDFEEGSYMSSNASDQDD